MWQDEEGHFCTDSKAARVKILGKRKAKKENLDVKFMVQNSHVEDFFTWTPCKHLVWEHLILFTIERILEGSV